MRKRADRVTAKEVENGQRVEEKESEKKVKHCVREREKNMKP